MTDARYAELRRTLHARMRRLDPEHADDLVQETLLRVHRALSQGDEPIERLDAWVATVARRVWIDHLRTRRVSAELPELASAADEPEATTEVASWLPSFVDALPEPYRTAVRRVDLDGLSQAELARELELSLSGARSRVQRGRAMLKGELLACCHVGWEEGEVVAIERQCGC
ncbi:MAG: sigma-70 family RNA polymerase sigma factor [Deltaproteobacteria bacterium]|nr:MAG: sigma-70 family RNA polymerase sigma factor [Deltaproteobacteria bacterium]